MLCNGTFGTFGASGPSLRLLVHRRCLDKGGVGVSEVRQAQVRAKLETALRVPHANLGSCKPMRRNPCTAARAIVPLRSCVPAVVPMRDCVAA